MARSKLIYNGHKDVFVSMILSRRVRVVAHMYM